MASAWAGILVVVRTRRRRRVLSGGGASWSRCSRTFAYIKRHHMIVLSVVREACELAGAEPIAVGSVYHIQAGRCVAPEWLVARCCEAMGRTVEEVMDTAGSGTGTDSEWASGAARSR